ncbi:uncharacterized protein K441DRAFT_331980 [Cenococcum geophilum 1.58]|uniref:Uncharacterized protein n=1 Tax=Cenococcum geophilum 1.58 TaxID=794803 RepID=A0ACC8EPA6_9PEZI|nr:hypothetical protein K441DRAFT_331980 [Cenococcum geophilum 1.58]
MHVSWIRSRGMAFWGLLLTYFIFLLSQPLTSTSAIFPHVTFTLISHPDLLLLVLIRRPIHLAVLSHSISIALHCPLVDVLNPTYIK